MEMKEMILLWMATALATTLAASDAEVLDESNKTLTGIPLTYPLSTTKLILHHNSITMNSSDTKSLSKLINLRELDLSYNHIEVLEDGAFSGLENLEVLNLSGNSFKTISKEALTGLNNLKKLDLQENLWHCNCSILKPFLQWMNESGVQIEGGTCASPKEQAKQRVMDLISECFTTAKPPSATTITTTTTTSTTTATTTAPPPPPPPPPPPTATTTTTKATTSTKSTSTTTTTTTTTTSTTSTTTIPTTTTTTNKDTATAAAPASTVDTTAQWTSHLLSPTLRKTNISNKDSLTETGKSGKQEPGVSNTWKFLAGVIVIALCTSMFIVCAVKSPSWYKMLFNYRHQRLREEEPNVFSTGRYSNFSLDTEQTETSAYELEQGLEQPLEDEDGFIEDRYIQPEDYKEHTEDYKDHSDADEV